MQGLRELGYIDGKNIMIDFRGAAGNVDRLSRLSQKSWFDSKSISFWLAATPVVAGREKCDDQDPYRDGRTRRSW